MPPFVYLKDAQLTSNSASYKYSIFFSDYFKIDFYKDLYNYFIISVNYTLYYIAYRGHYIRNFFLGLVVAVYSGLRRTVRSRRSYIVLSDSYEPRISQQICGVCQQITANCMSCNKFIANRIFYNKSVVNYIFCIFYNKLYIL